MKSPHNEIEAMYERTITLGMQYIEAEARRIMRRHKKYRTFICAMGSAFFADREDRYYDADDTTLFPALAEFLNEWDQVFKFTGGSFRLDWDGNTIEKKENW
jgi:hypothetical protein